MVLPRRGHLQARRLYRIHPNRTSASLIGHDGRTVMAEVRECFWTGVEERDRAYLGTYRGESRTWHIPVVFLRSGTNIESGMRLVVPDGTKWEIRQASLRAARHTWHCPSVELKERT